MPVPEGAISLFSLNIERSKHLATVVAALRRLRADVMCLQGVCYRDIDPIAHALEITEYAWAPMGWRPGDDGGDPVLVNTLILSRLPIIRRRDDLYYAGSREGALKIPPRPARQLGHHPLLVATVLKQGKLFNIATTHGPWTPGGEATADQRQAIARMLWLACDWRQLVLAGDLNAPRPGPIYQLITRLLLDCVPDDVESTIDPILHRESSWLRTVIDYIFVSRRGYDVRDVQPISGLSDHLGLLATIVKTV